MRKQGTVYIEDIRYDRFHSWKFKHLMAPYWRFYWNRQSTAYIKCNDQRITLENSAYYLIPPHTKYEAANEDIVDHLYIHFYLDQPFSERSPICFGLNTEVRSLLKRLTKLCRQQSEDSLEHEKTFTAQALIYGALSRVPFEYFKKTALHLKMDTVIEYMLEHMQEGPTNQELAETAGMSMRQFLRAFQERFQITPAKYMNLQRVHAAASMLHRDDMGIEEIAEQTGFYDRYHFSKVFKRYRGISPAAFRKTMQNQ